MNGLRVLVAVLLTAGVVFGVLTYKTCQDGDPSMESHAWSAFTCLSLGVTFWALMPHFQRLMDVLQ